MANLAIPVRMRRVFAEIRNLTDEQVAELERAIDGVRSPRTLAEDVGAATGDLMPEDQKVNLVGSLIGASYVRQVRKDSVREFVEAIADAMEKLEDPNRLSVEQRPRFSEIFERLMNNDRLALFAKASSLELDHKSLLHDSLILTDLRPVFSNDLETQGFVICHSLKIVYHDDARHREAYYSLDDNDLRSLKEAIERAERKAASLRALIANNGLTDLTT